MKEKFAIRLILVTLGEEGSIAFLDDKKVEQKAFLTDKSVDTTGAGDTFMGCCLAYILDNGIDLTEVQLKQMLIFSNAAASLETTRRGAIRAMPTYEKLVDYIKQLHM